MLAMMGVASSFLSAILMLKVSQSSILLSGAGLVVFIGTCLIYNWWQSRNSFFTITLEGISRFQRVPWNSHSPCIESLQWNEIDQIVVARTRTIFGKLGPLYLHVLKRGTNKWLKLGVNQNYTKTFQPVLDWVRSERTLLSAIPFEKVSSTTTVEKSADIVRTPATTINEPEILIARNR